MDFLTNDDVKIVYDDFGDKDKQPIVILSGIGAYKEYWEATLKMLLAHNYRVINIDARNQGQSEHTIKGLRMSRHAMDLAEIVNKLNLKKPILMGNSMGAATMFAYASLFSSKDIKAIIDVDQSPKMINDDNWQYGFKDLKWNDFHEKLKFSFGKATYHNFDNDLFTKLQQLKQKYPYDAALNYPLLINHAVQDWRTVINDLTCPLLIVCGEKSPFFNYEFGKQLAKHSQKITCEVIANAGHLVMAEQPESFNEILLKFLTEIVN